MRARRATAQRAGMYNSAGGNGADRAVCIGAWGAAKCEDQAELGGDIACAAVCRRLAPRLYLNRPSPAPDRVCKVPPALRQEFVHVHALCKPFKVLHRSVVLIHVYPCHRDFQMAAEMTLLLHHGHVAQWRPLHQPRHELAFAGHCAQAIDPLLHLGVEGGRGRFGTAWSISARRSSRGSVIGAWTAGCTERIVDLVHDAMRGVAVDAVPFLLDALPQALLCSCRDPRRTQRHLPFAGRSLSCLQATWRLKAHRRDSTRDSLQLQVAGFGPQLQQASEKEWEYERYQGLARFLFLEWL